MKAKNHSLIIIDVNGLEGAGMESISEQNMPCVTAIITTHNRYDLVQRAINSVQAQTYKNIELFVVDDASSENNKVRLKKYIEGKECRYIYIEKSESKGGNYARNIGIQKSTGEYVAFLDDDDEWFPEKIEKQVLYQKSHPECGVVGCVRVYEYDFKSTKQESIKDLLSGNISTAILTQMPYTTSSLLVKRELICKVGCFDENLLFWQDYELMIRLSQITDVGVVPEPLLLYRVIHKDRQRLTNNIIGWEGAVSYIEEKHKDLIQAASEAIQKKHQAMIAKDGAKRANRTGDKKLCRRYLGKAFCCEVTLKNLIKLIFNISHVDR